MEASQDTDEDVCEEPMHLSDPVFEKEKLNWQIEVIQHFISCLYINGFNVRLINFSHFFFH